MIRIIPVGGLPEIRKGDDLGRMLTRTLKSNRIRLEDRDVVVVAQKIVSKALGLSSRLDDVTPGKKARALARKLGKDARKVDVILAESRDVVTAAWPKGKPEGVLICRHRSGHISANAGVDESNADPGTVLVLPRDPDREAARLLKSLCTARRVGLIISDTFGRPWRLGLVNVAIGVAGMPAVIDLRGRRDASGRELHASVLALADEAAAAAGLAMGKLERIPAVVVRGLKWSGRGKGRDLVRPEREDLFRG